MIDWDLVYMDDYVAEPGKKANGKFIIHYCEGCCAIVRELDSTTFYDDKKDKLIHFCGHECAISYVKAYRVEREYERVEQELYWKKFKRRAKEVAYTLSASGVGWIAWQIIT